MPIPAMSNIPMTRPMSMPMPMPIQVTAPQGLNIPLPDFNIALINSLTDSQERKNIVGNAIYSTIVPYVGTAFAGKITGMVLDENAVRFELMMQDHAYFNKNINDAIHLLGVQIQNPAHN